MMLFKTNRELRRRLHDTLAQLTTAEEAREAERLGREDAERVLLRNQEGVEAQIDKLDHAAGVVSACTEALEGLFDDPGVQDQERKTVVDALRRGAGADSDSSNGGTVINNLVTGERRFADLPAESRERTIVIGPGDPYPSSMEMADANIVLDLRGSFPALLKNRWGHGGTVRPSDD